MIRHLRVGLMLTLTAVTGALDAVGYLSLDRVFTGNMTGNVVILGMGIASEEGLPVAGPLIALGGFTIGAVVAGLLTRGRTAGWNRVVTVTLWTNATVLAVVATVLTVATPAGQSAGGIACATTLAVVMGMQAAIARFLAVPDMTTVVVTSTITSFAGETLLAGGLAWVAHRRLWAVVLIFTGALVGALLTRVSVGLPVFVAAAVVLVCAVLGHRYWDRVPV